MKTENSSPALLRELWTNYRAKYHESIPNRLPISKRDWCYQMEYTDNNRLSKWMTLDAPNNRRIPLEHIPSLAIGMRVTVRESERDRLMATRLREMGLIDPSMKTAVSWAVDAGKRAATRQYTEKYALSDDEAFVLACYRVAKDSSPLGIEQTERVTVSLVAHFQVQLERSAEPLQKDLEPYSEEEAVNAAALKEKIQNLQKSLAQKPKARGAWREAMKRGAEG